MKLMHNEVSTLIPCIDDLRRSQVSPNLKELNDRLKLGIGGEHLPVTLSDDDINTLNSGLIYLGNDNGEFTDVRPELLRSLCESLRDAGEAMQVAQDGMKLLPDEVIQLNEFLDNLDVPIMPFIITTLFDRIEKTAEIIIAERERTTKK